MKFKIVSIQAMGSDLGRFLYVTLLPVPDPFSAMQQGGKPEPAKYWIRAALPYTPEFGQLQIGQEFDFKKAESIPAGRTYVTVEDLKIEPQEEQNAHSRDRSNRGRSGVRRKAVRSKSNSRNRSRD